MRRLLCLDGLRGVLAFYVMLSHSVPFAVAPAWLVPLFVHGGAAVDVFFILSGLVIVQSLASFNYQARPFLIARVARIFPVFLVVFAIALAIQPLHTGFGRMPWIGLDSPARFVWTDGWPSDWLLDLITHLTMMHGLSPDGLRPYMYLSFLGAAWSLSTEWQFYLLAVVIGARLGRGDVGLRRLACLFLLISVAAIGWHAVASDYWQFSRAFLPNKAQYFALGIASAVVVRGRADAPTAGPGLAVAATGRVMRLCRQAVSARFYLLVLFACMAVSGVQGGVDKLLPPLVWTGCLAAQLRPDIAALRPLAAVLGSRPLVWLGAVSYCIYLLNEPVQKVVGVLLALATAGNAALFTTFWLPAALLLPVLAAWWLHERIEAPALRWGRALARRGMAVVPVSAG